MINRGFAARRYNRCARSTPSGPDPGTYCAASYVQPGGLQLAQARFSGLAVGGMAHLKQHAGIRRTSHRRDVEVSRDVEIRPAFVYELLDAITVPREGSRGAGIERRAFRLAPHQLPEGVGDPLLPCAD